MLTTQSVESSGYDLDAAIADVLLGMTLAELDDLVAMTPAHYTAADYDRLDNWQEQPGHAESGRW